MIPGRRAQSGSTSFHLSSCRWVVSAASNSGHRQRSVEAASACFGASGVNNTLFRPSRQAGACETAEMAELKDPRHDEQTRLLDEADAKVRTKNQRDA